MGNKPSATFESDFTARLAAHSQVAYYPLPMDANCQVFVPFVVDQILVGSDALNDPTVRGALEARAQPIQPNASIFDGSPPPGNDVQVWRLLDASGGQNFPDVAELVWFMRTDLLPNAGIDLGQIAPNHIVIPAAGGFHTCPSGPPHPHDPGTQPHITSPSVDVAVIDSGWDASGPAQNLVADAGYAMWLEQLESGDYEWKAAEAPERLTADGRLYALAGHANFIAGVIAQACRATKITVDSLNAAFVEADGTDPAIPTEASVARALWNQRNNDLIHVGFAFPTLPSVQRVATDDGTIGPASWSLKVVLDALPNDKPHYVVSPAGNQGCFIPQYPAAFGPTYSNVIGVGSIVDETTRSTFSNHGGWVKCATQGDDVLSTFIDFEGETEEAEPSGAHPDKDFTSTEGWATWSGTSFSSPKVTGALAIRVAEGATLDEAWADLIAGRPSGLDVGVLLDGLAP